MNFIGLLSDKTNIKWWSDLKIAYKIGVGFGVLTILAATIGLIAIFGMGVIKKESDTLANESLPGLHSAYRAEKNWRETMFYLNSFDYTKNPFYYKWALKSLDKFKISFEWHEKLSENSKLSNKNIEKLEEIKIQLVEFKAILEEGYKLASKTEIYLSDLKKYSLKMQEVSGGNLSIYSKCITLSNNVIFAINSQKRKELLFAKQYAATFENEVIQIRNNGEFGKAAYFTFEAAKNLIHNYNAACELELKRHVISNLMKEDIGMLSDGSTNQINEMAILTNSIIGKSRTTLIGILIGILLLGLVFGMIISYSITSSLKKGVALAVNISNGQLQDQEQIIRKDEIGELMSALSRMNNQLKNIVMDITSGIKVLSTSSQEMQLNSTQMYGANSEQAATVEKISESIDTMHMITLQNSENANETERIARLSVNGILEGKEATDYASKSLNEIINRVSFISELAFKSNLLALNAAIESARFGEYGNGFGVVANEVKKLAESSKVAAQSIDKVSRDTSIASKVSSEKLNNIVPEIEKTANLVYDIKVASQDQATRIGQINEAIHQLNKIAQQNAASSENLSFSSKKLTDLSDKLRQTISFFNIVEGKPC